MKKLSILVLFILSFIYSLAQTNDPNRYASNSQLYKGKWIKIAIKESGIYKLTYEDISSLGIEPQGIRVHGYGGEMIEEDFTKPYIDDLPEVPIFMEKGSDGNFSSGDYILFYAKANIGWQYDKNSGFSHFCNPYSDKGYYFITSKTGEGRRIELQTPTSLDADSTQNTFLSKHLHEIDIINLANGGREFYGELLSQTKPTLEIDFNQPNTLPQEIRGKISIATNFMSNSAIKIEAEGREIANIAIKPKTSNNYSKGEETNATFAFSPTSLTHSIKLKLTLINAGQETYLNYIELFAKRQLKMSEGKLFFSQIATDFPTQQNIKIEVSGTTEQTQIWNITDQHNITSQQLTHLPSGKASFISENKKEIKEFVAIEPNANFPKPEIIGIIANQNLHSLPQADMLIITHSDFLPQAERLAEFHRATDGISVNVVDDGKIFNEFSSGTPDASAYRRFAKMFYDRGIYSKTTPRWLLLFGDGHFDNRGLQNTNPSQRRLLTYQAKNSLNTIYAYTSDDYFTYLDDTDKAMTSSAETDIAMGRIPAMTIEQARTAVDKIIGYTQNSIHGEWKNRMLFIADDGDNNIHISDCNKVADLTASKNPDMLIKKLYLDAYKQETYSSTESYPMVERMLDNYIKQGVLLINYMGHGSHMSWANEKIMTISKINAMTNDKLPIFVTATCDFSAFDQNENSGGELLLWNPLGGAVALITTTRVVYTTGNVELNTNLSENIFLRDSLSNLPLTLGEILQKAKNRQKNTDNKFAFTLLGDPAIRLAYPYEAKVSTDSINGKIIVAEKMDTISSLSEVRISGHIEDNKGDILEDFNGLVFINVFDKIENIRTLGNDADNPPFDYTDRTNPIFRGSTEVKNGKWSFTFLVPKDIKYNFGEGKIVYYAYEDHISGREANGSFQHFIIGGENPNPKQDSEGPKIRLYLNSQNFSQGDRVNSSPLLIAELFDESGINTSGNGIGHDIILQTEDEDIVLNEYYTSSFGDYRSGKVEYQLQNLDDGDYSLILRAWDLQNNSSTSEIYFTVGGDIKISAQIDIFPNPATDQVTFRINHDRPYQTLYSQIRVFDITGRKLWTSDKRTPTDSQYTEIQWNFSSDGLPLSKGLYLVQIEVGVDAEKSEIFTTKLFIK